MVSARGSKLPARAALAALLSPDSPIQRLADEYERAGHQLYLVGGAVRDALLRRSRSTPEFDFASDAEPEETRRLVEPFARAIWLQGAAYGTVGAEVDGLVMEITTFRTEKYQPSSRHPEVSFEADIQTDLSRRDFTINALAVNLKDRQMLDLFNGIGDLEQRLIRTPLDPRDSFGDDPLRMLRAFRFASELDFRISSGVLEAVKELHDLIESVSAERIRDEFSRLLVGQKPGLALQLAEEHGLTQHFLPELSSLRLEQDPVHRHKDVFAHTLAVLERTQPELNLRLAALLHDVGKPKTKRIDEGGVSFHHHEIVGSKMAAARLRTLRYPNEVVENIRKLIALHHRFHTYRLGWTDSAVRRYVRDAGPLLGDLNALVRADCTTRNPERAQRLAERMDELEDRIRELAEQEELARIRPELDGRQVMAYLGRPEGPLIGEAMEFLMEVRLEEGMIGTDEAFKRLDAWARERGIEPAVEKLPPQKKSPPSS
ncbi:MAG: CCA tRNA nucleotidyltransferase [Actinomycetota bacterium]|nr:CCA tRNA nucleotidyltransferase [Actinomycetota bacterium]